jgi:hypothetical protein
MRVLFGIGLTDQSSRAAAGTNGAALHALSKCRDGGPENRGPFLILDAPGAFHNQTSELVRRTAHSTHGLHLYTTELNSLRNPPDCSSGSRGWLREN